MSLSAFGEVKDEEPRNLFAENYSIQVNGKSGKGTRKQEIYRNRAVDDGVPMLVWAGDLDRDGRPDVLMELTDHYNVSKWTLFLSSKAEKHEVLGKVAQCVTTGC